VDTLGSSIALAIPAIAPASAIAPPMAGSIKNSPSATSKNFPTSLLIASTTSIPVPE